MVQRRPQVDDVALGAAAGVEALEDVGVQVDAQGAAATVAAVDGTGTAALRSATARQSRRQTQVLEDARQWQLPLQVARFQGSRRPACVAKLQREPLRPRP
jgi:hypothetical protein